MFINKFIDYIVDKIVQRKINRKRIIVHELAEAIYEVFGYDKERINKYVDLCEIVDVFKKKNVLYVTAMRPSIFIGRKREIINAIEKALGYKIKVITYNNIVKETLIFYDDFL